MEFIAGPILFMTSLDDCSSGTIGSVAHSTQAVVQRDSRNNGTSGRGSSGTGNGGSRRMPGHPDIHSHRLQILIPPQRVHQPGPGPGTGGPRNRRRRRRPTHNTGADSAYVPNIASSIAGGSSEISTKNKGTIRR